VCDAAAHRRLDVVAEMVLPRVTGIDRTKQALVSGVCATSDGTTLLVLLSAIAPTDAERSLYTRLLHAAARASHDAAYEPIALNAVCGKRARAPLHAAVMVRALADDVIIRARAGDEY
jgi:hypothetical protein